jgi:glycosyltransferase involved in cell wall biosynthesis
MRVQIVDPPAYTPPYDRSLCAALARAGADVELVTSRFLYGPVPPALGYRVSEAFYRRSSKRGLDAPGRRPIKLAEHVVDMLRYRRDGAAADVLHYQWLPVPALDCRLLPPSRPRILTAHGVLRREAWEQRPGRSLRRLLGSMDAIVVLSEFGRQRLLDAGVDGGNVRVIPHGAFDYLAEQPDEAPLPDELAAVEGPVILYFGLIRPYKGVDVLLEAFRRVSGAELWIVGMPRMDLTALRRLADQCPGTVRFVDRFITDPEIPAYFRRADVVALPYRQIEQSGVLYTALAFGKAIVASSIGGFTEIGERDRAVRLVPPSDPAALGEVLTELLGDESARAELASASAAAAAGPYSWNSVAARTLDVYRAVGAG